MNMYIIYIYILYIEWQELVTTTVSSQTKPIIVGFRTLAPSVMPHVSLQAAAAGVAEAPFGDGLGLAHFST